MHVCALAYVLSHLHPVLTSVHIYAVVCVLPRVHAVSEIHTSTPLFTSFHACMLCYNLQCSVPWSANTHTLTRVHSFSHTHKTNTRTGLILILDKLCQHICDVPWSAHAHVLTSVHSFAPHPYPSPPTNTYTHTLTHTHRPHPDPGQAVSAHATAQRAVVRPSPRQQPCV